VFFPHAVRRGVTTSPVTMSERLAPRPRMRKDGGMLGKANSILRVMPRLSAAFVLGIGFIACDSKPTAPDATPDAADAAANVNAERDAGTPEGSSGPSDAGAETYAGLDADKVREVLNPEKRPGYTGPTASIEGTVRITGAPPPAKAIEIPSECESARGFFGPLFRKGPQGELADALVAVTGYENAYVPEKEPAVTVTATDCEWDARTYVLTYGQSLKVKNVGKTRGHLPQLLGARQSAMHLAIPGGSAVTVFPDAPGHMQLSDATNLFMAADVFVLRYPTTDVTDVAGHYRIDGVPVGEVTVNALLPATQATAAKVVKLKPGETAQVDFELKYEAKK
jgi:hypothetical protein